MAWNVKKAWAVVPALAVAGCSLSVDVEVGEDDIHVRGSGVLVTQVRDARGFHGVSVAGAAKVRIERTGRERVEITAEDNLQPYLGVSVRGGILHVGPEPGVSLSPTRDITVVIEVEELDRVEASGVVEVDAALGEGTDLRVILSGVTRLDVSGSVEALDVTLSGASAFHGLDLESERARVTASGACSADVNASDELVAWASGVTIIRYIGDPTVEAHVSGLAIVRRY